MILLKKLLLLLLISCSFSSFSQTWSWSQNMTDDYLNFYSSGTARSHRIRTTAFSTDGRGNVYTATGFTLYDNRFSWSEDSVAIRVAKYHPGGALQWAKYFKASFASFQTPDNLSHVYDIETDAEGNSYIAMRRLTTYNDLPITNVGTPNCIVKLNSSGALVWIKPLGSIEEPSSASQNFQLAMNHNQPDIYLCFELAYPGTQVLDQTFTIVSPNRRFLLCRFDSTGNIKNNFQLTAASLTPFDNTLTITDNNDVLISANVYTNSYTIADTTITFTPSSFHKSFYCLLDGNNFSRKWVSKVEGLQNNGFFNFDRTGAAKLPGNKFALLADLAVSPDRRNLDYRMVFGKDTITVHLATQWENPFLMILNESGKLVAHRPVNPESRMISWLGQVVTDELGNIYTSGLKQYDSTADNYPLMKPAITRFDQSANRVWQTTVGNINPLNSYTPQLVGTGNGIYSSLLAIGPPYNPLFGTQAVGFTCSNCWDGFLSLIGSTGSNYIEGRLYADLNNNQLFDSGDQPIVNKLVAAGSFITFSDTAGNYKLYVNEGTHAVKIPDSLLFFQSTPDSHLVQINTAQPFASGKNFIFTAPGSFEDVAVDITQLTALRPMDTAIVQVSYSNRGIFTTSGQYSLQLPAGVRYLFSDSTALGTTANIITWNYNSLAAGQSRNNKVALFTDEGNFGDIKTFIAAITPFDTDTIKNNNTDTAHLIISASFDPNDKSVFPAVPVVIDFVRDGKADLEYLIRFQNTGNDTAFRVIIRDTLSAKLKYQSIQLISNSHPVQLKWEAPNIVSFYFENILLPDSNKNEQLSHGFVKFSIKPLNNLQITDSIINNAAIYFDYNVPVITNKVITKFRAKNLYTFTGSGNWSNAVNWANNQVPPATLPSGSTEIIINSQAGSECILDIPYTLPAGTKFTVMPGKKLMIPGNLILQ